MAPRIRELPESVWARIAAGEVVERPASAVKEMVENALDAGARRIRVRLWDGGRLRIVVEDDGCGIALDDLPLALTPHATSKIGGIEDLEAIRTLGYRGEALASLTAVATVEIRSRPEDGTDGTGGLIRASEGRVSEHTAVNCTAGTRVQVDELFGNLPARRKFLKSAAGELRRAALLMREYAICRPDVSFVLEHDGREVLSTDGSGDRRRAIERLWGPEPAVQTVRSEAGHLSLECWWQPRQGRNDIAAFVNGRAVTDPVVKGAVSAAARELIGNWALLLSIDPSLVDVNIHPAKAEIRFRYPGEVFEAVREAAALLGGPAPVTVRDGRTWSTDSAPPGGAAVTRAAAISREGWGFRDDFSSPSPPRVSERARTSEPRGTSGPSFASPFSRIEPPPFGPEPAKDAVRRKSAEPPVAGTSLRSLDSEGPKDAAVPDPISDPIPDSDVVFMGQMGSGYLVFDAPDGLVLVDPHAAHERVGYERIRAAAGEGRVQPLLVPVPLPPTLALEAEEHREALVRFGFELEDCDGGTRLRSVPSVGGAVEPEALLRGSLGALKEERDGDAAELLWRTWATMACKAAVKLTTRLSREEALVLWRDLHACAQPYFCPHGRPTVLRIDTAQLVGHFGRE